MYMVVISIKFVKELIMSVPFRLIFFLLAAAYLTISGRIGTFCLIKLLIL